MKKLLSMILFFLMFTSTVVYGATNKFWAASCLVGGGNCLDGIDGDLLTAGDAGAVVFDAGSTTPQMYMYRVYESSGVDDSLNIIAPDTNAGTKRWHLVHLYGRSMNSTGTTDNNYIAVVGNTSRAATAASMELYPEGDVWKLNNNGTEKTMAYLESPVFTGTVQGIVERIGATFDGGGAAIADNKIAYIHAPYAFTINEVTVVCDRDVGATTMVFDVQRIAFSDTTLPTASIVGAGTGIIVPNTKLGVQITPTSWTDVTIDANDVLAIQVTTASLAQWCTVSLKVTR